MSLTFACIVPTTGRPHLYERALPSLERQRRKFDEIVIISDTPREPDVESQIPIIRLTTGGGKGGPAARAIAYANCSSRFVVLLDDDDFLRDDFLEKLENFLASAPEEPGLVVARVRKLWLEGRIPAQQVVPPAEGYSDLSAEGDWHPSTSSGLVLSRRHFPNLPVSSEIKGFNDIQIWRAAIGHRAPVFYCDGAEVVFCQYFSAERLTSSFNDRVENLRIAQEKGLTFSADERRHILLGALLSECRSVAFREGLIPGIRRFFDGAGALGFRLRAREHVKIAINAALLLWLSLSPRRQ